jgi:valyl-tRNA synthetase
MTVLIPMSNLIDKGTEIARLEKEIQRLEGEVSRVAAKLDNPQFVGKAPAAVVEKERAKLNDAQDQAQKLREQLNTIDAL